LCRILTKCVKATAPPAAACRGPDHAYPIVERFPVSGWTHEQEHLSEVRSWWRSRRAELRRR